MKKLTVSDYQSYSFEAEIGQHQSIKHDVYERGKGPVIVLIQELPGIGQKTLRLADTYVKQGFTVVLPHLFGPVGKVSIPRNFIRVLCMRKEFHNFAKRKSSPVVNWLRALCQEVKEKHQVPGVGVIGMCLTGNFAISLMADDSVLAGSLPNPACLS